MRRISISLIIIMSVLVGFGVFYFLEQQEVKQIQLKQIQLKAEADLAQAILDETYRPIELLAKVSGPAMVQAQGVITVEGVRVHLDGLKPPREDADCRRFAIIYQCTLVSRGELVKIIAGKVLDCDLTQYGADDRIWGFCWNTDPNTGVRLDEPSINEQLVRAGWAFPDTTHTDMLANAESSAADQNIGLWNTSMRNTPMGTMDSLFGRIEVRNAGAIEVNEIDLRLIGIDAPVPEQMCTVNDIPYPCGVVANAYLIGVSVGKRFDCAIQKLDGDTQPWALCIEAKVDQPGQRKISINESIVRAGWALSRPEGGVDFSEAESAAQSEGVGLWSTNFVSPSNWRMGQR